MWTAPQRRLLLELNLIPEPDARTAKKSKANAPNSSKAKKFPERSGNLETPLTNPQHRKLMGQPENPHDTMSDKIGRPQAQNVRPKKTTVGEPTVNDPSDDPSGLENLGHWHERGIIDPVVGDDAAIHPSIKKHSPARLQGPSETPGKQTYTGFGNRYPGARGIK